MLTDVPAPGKSEPIRRDPGFDERLTSAEVGTNSSAEAQRPVFTFGKSFWLPGLQRQISLLQEVISCLVRHRNVYLYTIPQQYWLSLVAAEAGTLPRSLWEFEH